MRFPRSANYPDGPPSRSPGAWDSRAEPSCGCSPVTFERPIRVTIEYGHANKRSDDYSSVAYWYQTESHSPFSIEPVERRVPRQV